ncbi:hypothetical protein HK405_000404, partial [Cladochytrium tenue]
LLGDTPVRSAPLSDEELTQGHRVHFAALNHNFRPVCVETTVTDITAVTIPQLDTPLAAQCSSGFLADQRGRVQGLWLSFLGEKTSSGHDNEYFLGVPSRSILSPALLGPLRLKETPVLRGLAVELTPVQMAQARHMGLSDDWVRRVERCNPQRRQVFMVRNVEAGSKTATALRELDILLAVERYPADVGAAESPLDVPITKIHELDVGPDWPAASVRAVVLREKRELLVEVPVEAFDGFGATFPALPAQTPAPSTGGGSTTSPPAPSPLTPQLAAPPPATGAAASEPAQQRVVLWAGALVQSPHRSVLLQSRRLPSLVYVSARSKGSPAYTYGLAPTQWVTHVAGSPTPTLDAFVAAVARLGPAADGTYVRVRVVSFDLVPAVLSVKLNLHYWPTVQ